MSAPKKKLTIAQSQKVFYNLKKLMTTIGPGIYLFYMLGGFSGEFTTTGIKTGFIMIPTIIALSYAKDIVVRIKDKRRQTPKTKALAKGVAGVLPWVSIMAILAAVQIGLANIFQHAMIVMSMLAAGGIFGAFENYYIELGVVDNKAQELEKAIGVVSKTLGGAANV